MVFEVHDLVGHDQLDFVRLQEMEEPGRDQDCSVFPAHSHRKRCGGIDNSHTNLAYSFELRQGSDVVLQPRFESRGVARRELPQHGGVAVSPDHRRDGG